MDLSLFAEMKNVLMIAPDSYKKKLLEYFYQNRMIADIKFMDLNEYKKRWFFDYDIRALKYLCDRYGLSVSNAREILEVLHNVEDKKYGISKLDTLVDIRKQLDKEGLLIYDPLFKEYLKKKKIVVWGYGKLDEADRGIIDGEVIEYGYDDKTYDLHCFEEIEDEVEYVYDMISDLLREGTDINRIFILNMNSDYESYIRRFNRYYGFTLDYKNDDTLIGTEEAAEFLELIRKLSKEELFAYYQNRGDENSSRFLNIINRYTGYDLKQMEEFIRDDLKNTSVSSRNLTDTVKCADMFSCFTSEDHVFLLGFNDMLPAMKSDTEYITDNIRELVGLSRCEKQNETIRANTCAYLSGIADLHLSCCRKSPFREYQPNLLYPAEKINRLTHERSYEYADDLNRTRYAYLLDRMYRYNLHDDDIDLLYKRYRDNDYMTYDNRFSGIDDDPINRVMLSYSSMDQFYRCQFAYYVQHILGVNDFENTFYTRLGTLCHDVLADCFTQEDFDFERSWETNRKIVAGDEPFPESEGEAFFLNKIREELIRDIGIIKKQNSLTKLNKHLCEKDVNVMINDRTGFKGFIDKVMYKENDENVIASIIDYKTGNTKINTKYMEYGLSLQLPSYLYLLSNSGLFDKQIKYAGFYLQHLINNDRKYYEDKTAEEVKEDSMKLEGYTTADQERLSYWDSSIAEGTSSFISGLKLKKDGSFYAGCKVLSDEGMQAMIDLVDEKVRKAGKAIHEGDFRINPKLIDEKNASCGFCPYEAICYRRYRDYEQYTTAEGDEDDG